MHHPRWKHNDVALFNRRRKSIIRIFIIVRIDEWAKQRRTPVMFRIKTCIKNTAIADRLMSVSCESGLINILLRPYILKLRMRMIK
ncbi:MAG: hypothetical protein P8H03_07980 [Emcibacteraceae bacterium]|nr:hypothetical protein [Emcibacteraceae bacterium]